MTKIRLKYSIAEFYETLYEVDLKISHQEEPVGPRRPHKPGRSGKPSEAQRAHRQHFKLANAYAKAAMADPEVRTQYEAIAQHQGKRPRGAAIADYLAGNDRLSKKKAPA